MHPTTFHPLVSALNSAAFNANGAVILPRLVGSNGETRVDATPLAAATEVEEAMRFMRAVAGEREDLESAGWSASLSSTTVELRRDSEFAKGRRATLAMRAEKNGLGISTGIHFAYGNHLSFSQTALLRNEGVHYRFDVQGERLAFLHIANSNGRKDGWWNSLATYIKAGEAHIQTAFIATTMQLFQHQRQFPFHTSVQIRDDSGIISENVENGIPQLARRQPAPLRTRIVTKDNRGITLLTINSSLVAGGAMSFCCLYRSAGDPSAFPMFFSDVLNASYSIFRGAFLLHPRLKKTAPTTQDPTSPVGIPAQAV